MPTIRRAEPADREAIIEMKEKLQTHIERSNPDAWQYTDEGRSMIGAEMDVFMDDPDSITFVAEEDRIVIAYGDGLVSRRTAHLPPTIGYIGTIYVEESHRQRGVGTQLVKSLCAYFKREGVDQVNLRYVKGNEEAEWFWTGLGFRPVITTALTSLEDLEERLRNRQGEGI